MRSNALPLIAPLLATSKAVDSQRIIRAIASSTAIETGETTQAIELRLHADDSKYRLLDLAPVPAR